MKKIIGAMILSFICFSAYARDGRDAAVDLKNAAKIVDYSIQKEGIYKLINRINNCYAHVDNKYFCIYLDIGGKWMDNNLGVVLNGKQNTFFTDQNISNRLGVAYEQVGITNDGSVKYSQSIYEAMGSILSNMK